MTFLRSHQLCPHPNPRIGTFTGCDVLMRVGAVCFHKGGRRPFCSVPDVSGSFTDDVAAAIEAHSR